MKTIKLCAIALSLSCVLPSYADSWPTKKFESVVVTTLPNGMKTTTRTINDGKGHMRVESETPSGKSITLMNYPKHEMVTLLEAQKMALTNKLPDYQDSSAKGNTKGKDLGKKTVNGHPCHGVLFEEPTSKTEVWTGEDINSMVKSTCTTAEGNTVTELQSYSANPHEMPAFTVPAGYKTIASN